MAKLLGNSKVYLVIANSEIVDFTLKKQQSLLGNNRIPDRLAIGQIRYVTLFRRIQSFNLACKCKWNLLKVECGPIWLCIQSWGKVCYISCK